MSARIGASPCLFSANGNSPTRISSASAITASAPRPNAAGAPPVDAPPPATQRTASAARTRGSAASISSSETAPTEMRNHPLSSLSPKA